MEDEMETKYFDSRKERLTCRCSLLTSCIAISCFLIYWAINILRNLKSIGVQQSHNSLEMYHIPHGKHFLMEFLLQFDEITSSVLAGFAALIVCWNLTYFNWLEVGSFPATPLSPKSSPRRNIDHMNDFSKPAILSSLGLAPLVVGITTSYFVWNEFDQIK